MAVAVGLGPLQLVVRAGLRAWGGKAAATRWQRGATLGLGVGLAAAPAMPGATLGGEAAVAAAVLGLAFLLFVQDLAWRWLPLEWSLPLLVLGLIAGILGERGGDALAGAALGAGLLWALQAVFRIWRGVEALGTGDIWLAAAIGSFCGPAAVALTLGLAALSGLAFASLQLSIAKAPGHNRWGVAYGSHLIAVFIFLHSAPFQLVLMIATVAVVGAALWAIPGA